MYLIHTSENVKGVCTINFMADWGKLSARIIGLGLEPYEGFEIVFLQQAAGKLYYMGTRSVDGPACGQ